MRKIKFRGKRKDNKKWICGDLICVDNNYYIFDGWQIDHEMSHNCYEVITETVGQYTGLKDKNNREIYEGDIIEDADKIGIVEYVPEHSAFLALLRSKNKKGQFYCRIEGDSRLKETEIIGNVHDSEVPWWDDQNMKKHFAELGK